MTLVNHDMFFVGLKKNKNTWSNETQHMSSVDPDVGDASESCHLITTRLQDTSYTKYDFSKLRVSKIFHVIRANIDL